MLKTWKFWRTFFTTYVALVAGIWGVIQIYSFFREDELKQLFNSNWLMIFYVIPLFIAFSVAALTTKEDTQAETLDQHNRRVMLNHVENFWVKGVLEKSLHGAALFELGIKEDPNAINYPWAIKRESTNKILPAGKSMLEIFEEIGAGHSLLILGAPGSGKTTMLLELARQLIERARKDESEPIPVVFNLASWTEKQILTDWLAEQLNVVYYVPRKTAPKWISENTMLLLLDGLDEVTQESRTKCVEAINLFRKEHGLSSLAVCSRIEEYQAINAKLSLDGAITLQSLTSQQVDVYLDMFGNSLASIRLLLKKDKVLEELAETPLMLSIMTLAYKDVKVEDLLASKNKEDQRKHLFNTYINRMFERSTRTTNPNFKKQQTLYYLSWLARKMIQHNLITYPIEAMQPSWLDNEKQRCLYKWIDGLIVGLLGGLIGGLLGETFGGLFSVLIFGLIGGLIFVLGARLGDELQMVDKLRWTWNARFGLIGGLIGGLIAMLLYGLIGGLLYGLIFGLIGGLSLGLSVGLILGLSSEQIEETNYPEQHINQTLYNAIFIGLIGGLIAMLLYVLSGVLIFVLSGEMRGELGVGLIYGLSGGLAGGLAGGFVTLLQHYTLRNILMRKGYLPQSLLSFLEYAVDLIFLRRVGGSYIFVHRLLMEYFAEMEVTK